MMKAKKLKQDILQLRLQSSTTQNAAEESTQNIAKTATTPHALASPRIAQLAAYSAIANRTHTPAHTGSGGLPQNLQAGIESLSGIAMHDVRVHYNSSKPAQLRAHAYAQGTDIHLAPGQEKHLAHEAWHVVQQKQDRVKPTLQLKGVAINDDSALEREADVMGAKALTTSHHHPQSLNTAQNSFAAGHGQMQRQIMQAQAMQESSTGVMQRVKAEDVPEVSWGDHNIKARPVTGLTIAGNSQTKVMANLQKMLKLLSDASQADEATEEALIDFAKAYDLEEQCFGYTEIMQMDPVWLRNIWAAVCAWNATDLDDLRAKVGHAVTARRTEGDVVNEALLLMREGFQKQGGAIADEVPDPEEIVRADVDFISVGQATGTILGAADLGRRLSAAAATIGTNVASYSMEISSGGHSTRCNVDTETGEIIAFDPDNVQAFITTQSWAAVGAHLWSGLSHRRDGAVRNIASIDIDIQIADATDMSDLKWEDGDNLLAELAGELINVTTLMGLPDDLLHILEYNKEGAIALVKKLKAEAASPEKFRKMTQAEGAGGGTWDIIKASKREEDATWGDNFEKVLLEATRLANMIDMVSKAKIQVDVCQKEVARIAKLKPKNARESKRLGNRSDLFGRKLKNAFAVIKQYEGKIPTQRQVLQNLPDNP
jgi:Domain of unknown function (DUF4157)